MVLLNNAQLHVGMAAASWKAYAEQLSGLLHSRQGNEDLLRTLEALNAFLYPVENLGGEVSWGV